MNSNTIREFGGGWNVIDSPTGLAIRYASVLKNWYRKQDGSQALRYGTEFQVDISLERTALLNHGTWLITEASTDAFGDAVANSKSLGFGFRASASCDLGEVVIDVDTVTVGDTFQASLYTNNAGSPGTLVASSDILTISTTGEKTFTFATRQSLVSGTDYWIVITNTGTIGNISLVSVANQGGNIKSGKNDTITSIADDQLTSSRDWKLLVKTYVQNQGEIVDFKYFNGRLVVVTDEGEIVTVDGDNNVETIWNEDIANLETGNPTGWSAGLELITFTELLTSLVICNGVDKPVEVQSDFDVRYLQDLATGSNTNVPIGFYCTTVSDYLVIAGIDEEETTIYIGSKGTIGVFPGDDPPNDAVSVDLSAYVPEEGSQIRGLSSFRNQLFVHFFSVTLVVILGEYEDGDHIPRVDDALQKFGLLSHRCAVPVINDLLFPDITGANTARKNVFSGAVEPSRLSDLIAPAYQNQVAQLTQDEMLTDAFAVHDRLAGHYMVFIPDGVNGVRGFVFTFNEGFRVKAWSEFVGWTWRAATSSALGRVYFAKDTRIYQYGNEAYEEEFSADLIGEYDSEWANSTSYEVGDRVIDNDLETPTVYICLVDHTSESTGSFEEDRTAHPTLWEEYVGENIEFDWEFPWMDAGSRARIKRLANLGFDTQGTSQFDVDVFVDNIYKDMDDEYDPALTLGYTAGDSPGYGGGDQPYGGGRRTTDERMWSHPVKFRLAKLRIHGETVKPLRMVSIILLYAIGRYGR